MKHYQVSIYYHHYASSDDALAQLQSWLTEQQKQSLEQLKSFNGQLSFASSRALMNAALGKHLNVSIDQVEIEKDAKGKPHIACPANSSCRFNLTHTHELSAIAITNDLNVGIDVESMNRKNRSLAIAKSYFHPDEYEALKNIEDQAVQKAHFYRLWTMKEAYLKATGGGIADSLKSIRAELDHNDQLSSIQVNKPGQYRQLSFSQLTLADHYLCAVAALAEAPVQVELALYNYNPEKNSFSEETLPTTAELKQVDLQ